MTGDALLRRRHPHHRRRHPRRHRRAAHRQRRPAGRGDAPPGHDDGRDQERLRPDRARRGAQPRGRPAGHRRDHLPRRARRARRSTPEDVRRPGDRADAGGLRSARPVDRRVLRARCLRRRPGPGGARRRCGRGASRGRLHANQLGPGPGVQLACELGLVAVDHCTYLDDADVDRARRLRHRRHACCPAWSSPPARPTPTRGGCSTPACASRWPATATPAPATPRRCRCASRWPCARWACRRPRRSAAATLGGARALDRDDVGHLRVGARADLVGARGPVVPSTSPTAPASPWSARPSWRTPARGSRLTAPGLDGVRPRSG